MVINPYLEKEQIMLSFITVDCFIPLSWRNDSIYEAVFPFEFKKRNKKYTYLEWYLWEGDVYVLMINLPRKRQKHSYRGAFSIALKGGCTLELIYNHPILTLLFICACGFWLKVATGQINNKK